MRSLKEMVVAFVSFFQRPLIDEKEQLQREARTEHALQRASRILHHAELYEEQIVPDRVTQMRASFARASRRLAKNDT